MMQMHSGSTTRNFLFAASITLNVCLVGFIGARLLHSYVICSERPTIDAVLSSIQAKLSRDDADKFMKPFRRDRKKFLQAQAELKAARAGVWKAIVKQPFDPAVARTAIEEWQKQWSDTADIFVESLGEAMQAISPEDRAVVVRMLTRGQPALVSDRRPDGAPK
jgi:uncharacterized membrane protein